MYTRIGSCPQRLGAFVITNGFAGLRESNDAIRYSFHTRIDNIWKQRHNVPGSSLLKLTKGLKQEIETYDPWDSCNFFCGPGPYYSYHSLTEKIREMLVIGNQKVKLATGDAAAKKRAEEIIAGVKKGAAQAEAGRKNDSAIIQAQQIIKDARNIASKQFEDKFNFWEKNKKTIIIGAALTIAAMGITVAAAHGFGSGAGKGVATAIAGKKEKTITIIPF